MGYRTAIRHAADPSSPPAHRALALRSAVTYVAWATKATWSGWIRWIEQDAGMRVDSDATGDDFDRAVRSIERERAAFLVRLARFDELRFEEKRRGRRRPRPADLERLYDVPFPGPVVKPANEGRTARPGATNGLPSA